MLLLCALNPSGDEQPGLEDLDRFVSLVERLDPDLDDAAVGARSRGPDLEHLALHPAARRRDGWAGAS